MFAKLIIILLLTTPPALSFAANSQSQRTDQKFHHELKSAESSSALYNLALSEQKNGNLALALALSERGLFANPLHIKANRLRSALIEDLSDQQNEHIERIPFFIKILDLAPHSLILLVTLASLFMSAFIIGKLVREEKLTFKNVPQKRLRAAGASLLSLSLLVFLVLKTETVNSDWACVLETETPLFTGPHNEKFPQVSTLGPGNCVQVIQTAQDWVSLSPSQKTAGWALKKQVFLVRTNKFDPIFKSD